MSCSACTKRSSPSWILRFSRRSFSILGRNARVSENRYTRRRMRVLVLGSGKTGSLIPEIVQERGHRADVLRAADNPGAAALSPEALAPIDVVIDFTAPDCVLANIGACVAAGKN